MDRRAFLLGASGLAAAAYSGGSLARAALPRLDPRLRSLVASLRGPVITPADSAYDGARVVYNERYDAVRPLAVARPASVDDVRRIVAWAVAEGVRPIPRSGGHSYAGYSTGSGLVVDLRSLAGIAYERSSGVATIGAGARLIDVETALAAHGRAIPSGSCATVGIGGLTQGGGVGLASRMFGTTSDNVLSLGIVTADGAHRVCDSSANEDLYWACRGGGGGNFGIVTHFTFRTHPASSVSYFFADWSWSQASEVIEAWQAWAPHAADELFTICSLTGGGSPSVQVFGQYLGSESSLGRALAPLLRVPASRLTTGSSSYLDAQLRWADCLGKTTSQCHLAGETPQGTLQRTAFAAKSDYLNAPLSAAGRATLLRFVEQGLGTILLDSYGGAINRRAANDTAFVHRDALGSAQYLAYWSSPSGETAASRWLRDSHAAMRPYVSGFAYQNYIDHDLAGWEHAYYGANYPRLQRVKKDVDPGELFHFAQSIRPA
jgi:FAD/FMN-containing dehydrogenase